MAFLSSANSDRLLLMILRLHQSWGKCHDQSMMSVMGTRRKTDGLPWIYHPVQIPSFNFDCWFCFTDENPEAQRKTYPNFYKYSRDSDSPRQNFGWRQLASVQNLRFVVSFCVCVCVSL